MGFLDGNGLISKTKSMVLSLSNIISSSSIFQSPKKFQHEDQCAASAYKQFPKLPAGLKTLIYDEHDTLRIQSPTHHLNRLTIHSYTTPQPSPPSPPPSPPPPPPFEFEFESFNTLSSSYSPWSSGMDDMLGTESGVYMIRGMKMEAVDYHKPNASNDNQGSKRKRGRELHLPEEYPPPIPLLARTGNLPGHMPWILARYYSEGRLVIKEEKVKHHEYFEAYRENGRLILDLVPLDYSYRCCHSVFEDDDDDDGKEEIELENVEFFQGYPDSEKVEEDDEERDEADDDGEMGNVNEVAMTSAFSVPEFCHWNETWYGGEPRKCLTYSDPLTLCNVLPRLTAN
ncbi:hypothetical protein HRI_001956500 [Hibiscus trionum]|uniref:FAF domain-containing protein n=1 Tax=Hibiscus trionum TaxID=183268 RepID=A0A9W7HTU5_HIBTR|nr:hypothetical protein HRI_001956500 [Hibiscus trionum]